MVPPAVNRCYTGAQCRLAKANGHVGTWGCYLLSGALTGEFYIGGSRLCGGEPVAEARFGDEQLRAIGAF